MSIEKKEVKNILDYPYRVHWTKAEIAEIKKLNQERKNQNKEV